MLQACFVQRVTSARELVYQLPDAVAPSLGAIAAIPVRDEEDRIEACLDALLAQRDLSGRPLPPDALGLVLLLNNCSDRTAAIARGRLAASDAPFAVVNVALPPSQAMRASRAGWRWTWRRCGWSVRIDGTVCC